MPEDLIDAVKARGVRDKKLLKAFQRIERGLFLPPDVQSQSKAYFDIPIPISHGHVTPQPSLIARMIDSLKLKGSERVLEIGTEMGFQAGLLACLCRQVLSIERLSTLAAQARANLRADGVFNVQVFVGDPRLGLPDLGPFDAIIGWIAFPKMPEAFVDQLREKGKLVLPLGSGENGRVACFRKKRGKLKKQKEIARVTLHPGLGTEPVTPEVLDRPSGLRIAK